MASVLKSTLLRLTQQDALAKSEGLSDSERDLAYQERNGLVYLAVSQAIRLGYHAGIRVDPDDIEWPVLFMMIPVDTETGVQNMQISYHLYNKTIAWDFASVEEGRRRIENMHV